MDRDEVFALALERYGTVAEHPWNDGNAVLRHREGRWYAAVLEVRRDRLGLSGDGTVDVLNVKCDPALAGSLRTRPGFHAAYHMNKERWVSIRLDGSVERRDIEELLALSYELTREKKKRRGI